MRLRVIVVLLALAALPATASASPRIVGGQPASAQDLPFMVGLEIAFEGEGDDGPDALCGGAVVDPTVIMTAAHCLPATPQIDYEHSYAIIGATSLDSATPDQRFRLVQAVVPSSYDEYHDGSYDMGFVSIERPAPVAPLRVMSPWEATAYTVGERVFTAGWGLTEDTADGGELSTNQLRVVDLNIVSDQTCQSAFDAAGAGRLFFDTEICAIAPNKDSCNGDSGGPLFAPDVLGAPALIGVVSFGISGSDPNRADRSCNEGPPGVYSWVAGGPLQKFYRDAVTNVTFEPQRVPVAGVRVPLRMQGANGDLKGPFRGFAHIAWDLDNDGQFDEGADKRTVSVKVGSRVVPVGIRGTDAAGVVTTARAGLAPRPLSPVSFTHARGSAKASSYARVKLTKLGHYAGSVRVRVFARSTGATVHFKAGEHSKTVRVATPPLDTIIKPHKCHYRMRIEKFKGKLVAGTRTETCFRLR